MFEIDPTYWLPFLAGFICGGGFCFIVGWIVGRRGADNDKG